jgi:hypothetical protein
MGESQEQGNIRIQKIECFSKSAACLTNRRVIASVATAVSRWKGHKNSSGKRKRQLQLSLSIVEFKRRFRIRKGRQEQRHAVEEQMGVVVIDGRVGEASVSG